MATIEYKEESSWRELSFRVNHIFAFFDSYVFRGQADAKWELESSLARSLDKMDKKPSNKEEFIKKHLENFKMNIRGRTNLDLSSTSNNDEIWALGQHFGLYTPLLDWTRSPYVALFFALFGQCDSGKRSLWAILEGDINFINSTKKLDKDKVQIVDPYTHYNKRLVNQRGLFLNVPIGIELEKWIERGPNQEWVTMYKITFPDSIREEMLWGLNTMNINYQTLFPDIKGASLHTNYRTEAQPFIDKNVQNSYDEIEELNKEYEKSYTGLKDSN